MSGDQEDYRAQRDVSYGRRNKRVLDETKSPSSSMTLQFGFCTREPYRIATIITLVVQRGSNTRESNQTAIIIACVGSCARESNEIATSPMTLFNVDSTEGSLSHLNH